MKSLLGGGEEGGFFPHCERESENTESKKLLKWLIDAVTYVQSCYLFDTNYALLSKGGSLVSFSKLRFLYHELRPYDILKK